MTTTKSSSVRDANVPDLVTGVVNDMRELVEAHVDSLRSDLGDRLVDLGAAIRSWLIALCVAIVTIVLIGLAIAASLVQLGLPVFAALWLVAAISIGAVVALVYRARGTSQKLKGPHASNR